MALGCFGRNSPSEETFGHTAWNDPIRNAMNASNNIWSIAKRPFVRCWLVALMSGSEFAQGLYTGVAGISVGRAASHMVYAARATSPVKFWLIECIWLSGALFLAFYGTKDLIRFRRGLPEEPRPRPAAPFEGRLPEALAELVRTQQIKEESVPRLLKEMRPQLRPNDRVPVLHSHGIEWGGMIFGLLCVALMSPIFFAMRDPDGRTFAIVILGTIFVGTSASSMAMTAVWRRRRRKQMQWLLDCEARYQAAHKPPASPAPFRPAAPINAESIPASPFDLRS
jgi:hypothetical protein